MKCPHCLTSFHDVETVRPVTQDVDGKWGIAYRTCSACGKAIISLIAADSFQQDRSGQWQGFSREVEYMVRPKIASRTPPSVNVPTDISKDYMEACLVLTDSPQASAALSRRCLQHLLRKYAKVKPSDLNGEIDEIIARNMLPSMLADSIDAIRNIGNFAAHPIKSKTTGEIVAVEAGEAEWNLDVLESLFDFFFDQPALLAAKRDALNKKLASAGKPPLKKAP